MYQSLVAWSIGGCAGTDTDLFPIQCLAIVVPEGGILQWVEVVPEATNRQLRDAG